MIRCVNYIREGTEGVGVNYCVLPEVAFVAHIVYTYSNRTDG